MRDLDSFGDWLLFDLPRKLSGRVVSAIALLFYPGVALALPVLLGWSASWLVSANIVGASSAALLALGWLFLQIEARDRRHLLEWTSNLRLLDAQEFEWLVGELFRREGWRVIETGSQSGPDGNIDLQLVRGTEHRLVQCKRWTAKLVDTTQIRAFAGTLAREQLPTSDGTFVTLSGYTDQARQEAEQMRLEIIEGSGLVARLEKVSRPEACPVCATPMLLGRSDRGWWLRCPRFPTCQGKRDLTGDAGRAVELLTRQA